MIPHALVNWFICIVELPNAVSQTFSPLARVRWAISEEEVTLTVTSALCIPLTFISVDLILLLIHLLIVFCLLSHQRILLLLHKLCIYITMSVLLWRSNDLSIRDLQVLHPLQILLRNGALSLECEFFWPQAHLSEAIVGHINITVRSHLLWRGDRTFNDLCLDRCFTNILVTFRTNFVISSDGSVAWVSTRYFLVTIPFWIVYSSHNNK